MRYRDGSSACSRPTNNLDLEEEELGSATPHKIIAFNDLESRHCRPSIAKYEQRTQSSLKIVLKFIERCIDRKYQGVKSNRT